MLHFSTTPHLFGATWSLSFVVSALVPLQICCCVSQKTSFLLENSLFSARCHWKLQLQMFFWDGIFGLRAKKLFKLWSGSRSTMNTWSTIWEYIHFAASRIVENFAMQKGSPKQTFCSAICLSFIPGITVCFRLTSHSHATGKIALSKASCLCEIKRAISSTWLVAQFSDLPKP